MTMSLIGASSEEIAAYHLGRQSAEVEATRTNAIRSVFGRPAPRIDVNAVLIQNRALEEENVLLKTALDRTERNLAGLESDYAELRAWADMASRKLKQHGL